MANVTTEFTGIIELICDSLMGVGGCPCDAPNLGASFAAKVAQCANRHRHWWRRLAQPLPSTMLSIEQRWRRKLWVILVSLAVALTLVLGPDTRDIITAAAQPDDKNWTNAEHAVHGFGLTVLILLIALAFIYPKVFSGAQAIARFIGDPRAEAAGGSIDSVRKQLGTLIHQATRRQRRFVIFVDDLERCRPPRAVEVCEVASQLLDHDYVTTVLVGDMQTVARSAAIKYKALELPDSSNSDPDSYEEYGRAYLQKLVDIQFDLPPATPSQLKKMLQIADKDSSDKDTAPAASAAADESSATVSNGTKTAETEKIQPQIVHPAPRLTSSQIDEIMRLSSGKDTKGAVSAAAQRSRPPGTENESQFALKSTSILDVKSTPILDDSSNFSSIVALAILLFSFASFIYKDFGHTKNVATRIGYISLLVLLGVILLGIVSVSIERVQRWRAQSRRGKLDIKLRSQPAGTTVDQAVKNISVPSSKFNETEIRRRFFSAILSEQEQSGLRERIDELVGGFLPERPRAAKRLLNQVRLMMPIAIARGLFVLQGTEPGAESIAIRYAKWLILRERWPTVALAGLDDPAVIADLESAARKQSDSDWLNAIKSYNKEDIDSARELLKVEPDLGDLRKLVYVTGTLPEPSKQL